MKPMGAAVWVVSFDMIVYVEHVQAIATTAVSYSLFKSDQVCDLRTITVPSAC